MFVAIILVTIYVTWKEIKEKPANLFQAKAPKAGKTILLEKIAFIWSKLSFKYNHATVIFLDIKVDLQ